MIVYQNKTAFNIITKDKDGNDVYSESNINNEIRVSDDTQTQLLLDTINELKKINFQLYSMTENKIDDPVVDE